MQVTTGNNRVELSSAGSGRAWWVLGVYSMYDLHYLVTYVERIRMAMGLVRFSGLRCRTTRRTRATATRGISTRVTRPTCHT